MQFEELSKKLEEIIIYLDRITVRLERMEARQNELSWPGDGPERPKVWTFGFFS